MLTPDQMQEKCVMQAIKKSWWSSQQVAPLTPLLGSGSTLPRRRTFGGQCFHVTCTNIGADWYNKGNSRYYCDRCARGINEDCLEQGQTKLCELQLG
jgi:hypothetical protein